MEVGRGSEQRGEEEIKELVRQRTREKRRVGKKNNTCYVRPQRRCNRIAVEGEGAVNWIRQVSGWASLGVGGEERQGAGLRRSVGPHRPKREDATSPSSSLII